METTDDFSKAEQVYHNLMNGRNVMIPLENVAAYLKGVISRSGKPATALDGSCNTDDEVWEKLVPR